MALDRVLNLGQAPRSELQAMKDRKEECLRLAMVEYRHAGHSDEYDRLTGEADRLADEIFDLEKENLEAEEERVDRIRQNQIGGHAGWKPWEPDQ